MLVINGARRSDTNFTRKMVSGEILRIVDVRRLCFGLLTTASGGGSEHFTRRSQGDLVLRLDLGVVGGAALQHVQGVGALLRRQLHGAPLRLHRLLVLEDVAWSLKFMKISTDLKISHKNKPNETSPGCI